MGWKCLIQNCPEKFKVEENLFFWYIEWVKHLEKTHESVHMSWLSEGRTRGDFPGLAVKENLLGEIKTDDQEQMSE
jgi:hypothetical protein